MNRTRILWLAALLLAIAVLLAIRDHGAPDAAGVAQDAGALAATAPEPSATRATRAVHDDTAVRDALATLRAYVALLPVDLAKADAYWAGGAPARDAREADLRALPASPHRFRLSSRAAEAFSATPAGEEVEIPVALQFHYRDRPTRRYEGWYRLRRKDGGWEITGAAVDAVPARQ